MSINIINNENNYKLTKDNLIIVDIPFWNNLDKNNLIIQIISKLIIRYNYKVSLLYSTIRPKELYSFIINEKIKIDNIRKLSTNERRLKLENIKDIMKSNLCLGYTTGTTANEVIEKCTTLRNNKKVDFIIISSTERIKDLDTTNKQTFLKNLEDLSKQLNLKIILIL